MIENQTTFLLTLKFKTYENRIFNQYFSVKNSDFTYKPLLLNRYNTLHKLTEIQKTLHLDFAVPAVIPGEGIENTLLHCSWDTICLRMDIMGKIFQRMPLFLQCIQSRQGATGSSGGSS